MSDEWLGILLGHEEDSILLEMDGAIAGYHFTIVFESFDLDFRIFGRNQILQIRSCQMFSITVNQSQVSWTYTRLLSCDFAVT